MTIRTYRPSMSPAELAGVESVFQSGWLGMGEVTARFEERLKPFVGARNVVAVSRGTAALHLAIDALDLEPGAEVLVPSITFVGSIQAIRAAGAIPVFCEVEPQTLNIDVDDAISRITPRTRVIMPVHYAGLPCDMNRIEDMARDRGLRIIEDAAHAFGSSYEGRKIGSIGDMTCFSFDPIKTITCGDGGAVATDDDDLAFRIARRRVLGIHRDAVAGSPQHDEWQYEVISHGYRYHLCDVNAAIGLAQLDRFPGMLARRVALARRYDEKLAGIPNLVQLRRDLVNTCPWAYVVRVTGGRRDALKRHLESKDILTLLQFIPNHMQPAFSEWSRPLPITESLFGEFLSLPFYADLTDAEVDCVASAVRGYLETDAESGRPMVETTGLLTADRATR